VIFFPVDEMFSLPESSKNGGVLRVLSHVLTSLLSRDVGIVLGLPHGGGGTPVYCSGVHCVVTSNDPNTKVELIHFAPGIKKNTNLIVNLPRKTIEMETIVNPNALPETKSAPSVRNLYNGDSSKPSAVSNLVLHPFKSSEGGIYVPTPILGPFPTTGPSKKTEVSHRKESQNGGTSPYQHNTGHAYKGKSVEQCLEEFRRCKQRIYTDMYVESIGTPNLAGGYVRRCAASHAHCLNYEVLS
jgi:hypothetical protein